MTEPTFRVGDKVVVTFVQRAWRRRWAALGFSAVNMPTEERAREWAEL